jgi:hypothetical protein
VKWVTTKVRLVNINDPVNGPTETLMAKVPGAEGLLLVNPLRSGKKVESGVAPGRLLRLLAFSTRPYMQNHQYTRPHHPPTPNYSFLTRSPSEFYSIEINPAINWLKGPRNQFHPKIAKNQLQHLHKFFLGPFKAVLIIYIFTLSTRKVYKLQEYSCIQTKVVQANTN